MVYTEPSSLSYEPLVATWLAGLPPSTPEAVRTGLRSYFDSLVPGVLHLLRRSVTEPVPTTDNALVRSLMSILDCFLQPFTAKEGQDALSPEALKRLSDQVPVLFM